MASSGWRAGILGAVMATTVATVAAEEGVRMAETQRFLALGDSYTIGEGVSAAERWPVQLAAQLGGSGVAVGPPEIVATTGWTTGELLAGIDRAAPQGPVALVSLLIGVNNQYRGRPLGEFRLELSELVARAVGFAGDEPGRVLLLSIPDWGVTPFAADRDRERIAHEIDAFNAVVRDEAARVGARFVDVTAISRRAAEEPGLLAPDGLHPSGAMYAEWVAAVVPEARAALSGTGRPAREDVAVLETSLGTIVIRLLDERAPATVAAFRRLVADGFYDGTAFYRVVAGHVIQAGDGGENDRPKVPGEFGAWPHVAGAVGLARDDDPDSGSTEIYICHAPRPHLDGRYAVFGLVAEGLDVVDAIARVPVLERWVGEGDTVAFHEPVEPVVIREARLETRALPPLAEPGPPQPPRE